MEQYRFLKISLAF